MSSKRSRRDRKSVNGSSAKRGTRRNHSSSDEHDDKKNLRPSKSISNKNKSYVESSSEDDSDFKNRTRSKLRKNKPRESASESSEKDRKKSKLHRTAKKSTASDDDSGKRSKKNRPTKKQENSSSDDSSMDERPPKKVAETEVKRKVVSSEIEDSSCENNKKSSKKLSLNKEKSTSSDCEQGKVKNKENKVDEKVKETKSGSKSSGTLSAEDIIAKKKIKLAILWLNNTVKDIAELGTLVSVRAKKFGEKRVTPENLKTYEDVLNTVNKLKQLISGVHSNYEHIEKNLDAQLKPWKVLTGTDKDCAITTQEGEMTIVRSQTNKNILPESNDTFSCANISHDKVPVPEQESAKEDKTKPQDNDGQCELNWSADDSDNNKKKNTKDLESKSNDTLSFANNSLDKVPVPEKESAKEDTTEPQDNDEEFELNWSDDSDNNEKKNTKDLISKLNESLDKMDELEPTQECKDKKDKLKTTDECNESSRLELKKEDTNNSSNTSSFEKSTDDKDESSKVLANDSDEEKMLKIFPKDAEKVNSLSIFVVLLIYNNSII